MRQYRESGLVTAASRVPDNLYGTVLDNIVVCCVDCVVVNSGRLLLGRRTQYPYKGYWVMGGRMKPGEWYEETARRVVEQEVGLRIEDLDRFEYIDTACYVWARREQPPQKHGCHMEGNNFLVVISDAEAALIRPSSEDFAELVWLPTEGGLGTMDCHPSIRFLASYVHQRLEPHVREWGSM